MRKPYRGRALIEVSLALVSLGVAIVMAIWANWIELVVHADPDGGGGGLEWSIVALSILGTIGFSLLAALESRRSWRAA